MFSDVRVRTAKPGDNNSNLFDGLGLYLLITPGGGKGWRFKYRFGGKEKLISLGTYPEVGLKAAREKRDAARTPESTKLPAGNCSPARPGGLCSASSRTHRRRSRTIDSAIGRQIHTPGWAVRTPLGPFLRQPLRPWFPESSVV